MPLTHAFACVSFQGRVIKMKRKVFLDFSEEALLYSSEESHHTGFARS